VLKNTYLQFLHQLPFYGLAVVCLDDMEIQSILPDICKTYHYYGFSEEADVRANSLHSGFNESKI